MTNKFLVIPKKKNSVVKQEFYRKGKQSFYIEKIYSRPEILLDTKINTKKYDAISGMILKKYSFKEGEYDYKTKKIIHYFDDGIVAEGPNNLKVVVTDNVGNSAIFETQFFRSQIKK